MTGNKPVAATVSIRCGAPRPSGRERTTTGAPRRRWLATAALAAVILMVPVAIYAWGRQADTFAVKRVVVSGAKRTSAAKAAARLRAQFVGANLFTVGEGDVQRVLAEFPYLAGVAVDRDFPATLRVRLVEYRPGAYLLAAGRWYVVSRGGHVLVDLGAGGGEAVADAGTADGKARPSASPAASTSSAAATGPPPVASTGKKLPALPVLRSAKPVSLGAEVGDRRVRDALLVLGALPGSLRARVSTASVSSTAARVWLRDGLTIEFGSAAALESKSLALRAVLRRYRRGHQVPTFVDVSVPGRPLAAPLLATGVSR